MRRLSKATETIIWFFCGLCILLQPKAAAEGVAAGLQACLGAILPSLFPFFILTDYWVQAGYVQRLSMLASPFMRRFFHLPGAAAAALILGSVGGYPIGAKTAAQLCASGQLSKDDAEQTLYFCNNAGPAFVLGVIGNSVFRDIKLGVLLYIIHLISAYCVGFLLRPKKKIKEAKIMSDTVGNTNIANRITSAITNGGQTAILVCTYVVFFAIVTRCVQNYIPNRLLSTLIMGTIELTSGMISLSALSVTGAQKFVLAAALLSLGGLCVFLQSASILYSAGLDVKKLLVGKGLQCFFSTCFSILISPILPTPLPCAAIGLNPWKYLYQQIAVIILISILTAIFLKESSGNMENNQV